MADIRNPLCLREISFGEHSFPAEEAIRLLRDLTLPTEMIYLILYFSDADGFNISTTAEMRELIFEKKRHIQNLNVINMVEEKNENCKVLNFYIQLLLHYNGNEDGDTKKIETFAI